MQKSSPPIVSLLVSCSGLLLVAGAVFLPSETDSGKSLGLHSPVALPVTEVVFESKRPYLMDVQISSSQSTVTKTSSVLHSNRTVGSCITYTGGSGTYGFYYYEVPSSGSNILKATGYVTGPWGEAVISTVRRSA